MNSLWTSQTIDCRCCRCCSPFSVTSNQLYFLHPEIALQRQRFGDFHSSVSFSSSASCTNTYTVTSNQSYKLDPRYFTNDSKVKKNKKGHIGLRVWATTEMGLWLIVLDQHRRVCAHPLDSMHSKSYKNTELWSLGMMGMDFGLSSNSYRT